LQSLGRSFAGRVVAGDLHDQIPAHGCSPFRLKSNATTALAGVEFAYKFNPKFTLFASANLESDTNVTNGVISATGVNGLTPINLNSNPAKTRRSAIAGAYYDVAENQRVGLLGIYRQEPSQSESSTTAIATYHIGM
jgi:hypothetical protein